MLQQPFQQAVALLEEVLPTLAQVQRGGCVGQYGQGGSLGPGELGCRSAKIAPGSGLQPHYIPPEGCVGSIQGQDALLGIAQFQPHGQHGFNEFLPDGAFFLAAQADDLHAKGAAAAYHMAGVEILQQGPPHGHGVYARVPPELPVLKLHQRRRKAPRNGITGRKPPLPVGRNARPQQLPFGTLHHRGVGDPFKQVLWKTKQVG